MSGVERRRFLQWSGATALGMSGPLVPGVPLLSADEVALQQGIARFSSEMEPLVRFLEETPRERLIEETAAKVRNGLGYRQLLAAVLLAAVRNVQPRPSVGFKFHAVLVINSAHLASLAAPNEDRWLPLFWAIDNFKESQARDVQEGNWTLPAVDEANVPPSHRAEQELKAALEQWDESRADVAITSLVRHFGSHRVFEVLARYAARDFRSIGHKVIYLANATRTLQTIGWDYAEPVMRSLVYAMLNHTGEPNPAVSDLAPDQAGRENWERVKQIGDSWLNDAPLDRTATVELLNTLHEATPAEASQKIVELIGRGVPLQSLWDGLFAGASELLMRQNSIVSLHAVTTTNAIHQAFQQSADETNRKYLLLQNAAFLPMFRDEADRRGDFNDSRIQNLETTSDSVGVETVFQALGRSRSAGTQEMFNYLSGNGRPDAAINQARRLVFLKGNDSHDYKFSSAALEDYRVLSPEWAHRYLAASCYQLRSPSEPTRPLVQRIRTAFES